MMRVAQGHFFTSEAEMPTLLWLHSHWVRQVLLHTRTTLCNALRKAPSKENLTLFNVCKTMGVELKHQALLFHSKWQEKSPDKHLHHPENPSKLRLSQRLNFHTGVWLHPEKWYRLENMSGGVKIPHIKKDQITRLLYKIQYMTWERCITGEPLARSAVSYISCTTTVASLQYYNWWIKGTHKELSAAKPIYGHAYMSQKPSICWMTKCDLCVFYNPCMILKPTSTMNKIPTSVYLEFKLITPFSLRTNRLRYRKSSENVLLLVLYEGEQMAPFWVDITLHFCVYVHVRVCTCMPVHGTAIGQPQSLYSLSWFLSQSLSFNWKAQWSHYAVHLVSSRHPLVSHYDLWDSTGLLCSSHMQLLSLEWPNLHSLMFRFSYCSGFQL